MRNKYTCQATLLVALVCAMPAARGDAGTAFTYQGQIKLDGVVVNDTCDFEFSLWKDAVSELVADQIGSTLTFDGLLGNLPSIAVSNGLFEAELDFAAGAFDGNARWLEISAACPSGEAYTTLTPRQPLTPTPYALQTRGIFVDDNGDVGIGTRSPRETLQVAGNIALVVEGFDPYIELHSDNAADDTTMHLTVLDAVGFAVTDSRHQPQFVVEDGGNVGVGTTRPQAPFHVRGAGRFAGNHVAFFESTSGPSADGIAIQLSNDHTNRDNNFVTFLNGQRRVTGRIEGFDLENRDWVAPPPIPDVGLAFDPAITYNPNWLNLGSLPTASLNRGQLPTASFSRGELPTLSFNRGTLPSLSFSGGQLPSASLNGGTLPTLSFNRGTRPTLSWQTTTILGIRVPTGLSWSAGSTPSLSFSDGSLPTLSFNRGSLPTATFSRGSLPLLSFAGGKLPLLTFSGGALPTLTFNGGALPSIEKSPLIFGEPSLILDLPTAAELEALFCWSLETGVSDFLTLDPASFAVAALKQQVVAKCKDEGVTYGSKGADYAEWLPKMNPSDKFQFGQIVGVHGGKVSLKTEGAEQIMAVSRAPVVVGNVPQEGDKDRYITVGFMGQLPVVVRGTVRAGDYIVPSGREDGTAGAVSPDDLRLEHLGKTLGRAWSDSENDIYSLVNVAIGLNGNEAKVILERQRDLMQEQVTQQLALAAENARLNNELISVNERFAGLMDMVQGLEKLVLAQAGCRQSVASANVIH